MSSRIGISISLCIVALGAGCGPNTGARGGVKAWPTSVSQLPAEAVVGVDWYPVDRTLPGTDRLQRRLRTNHNLAELKLRFRGSTRIGARFESDHLTAVGIAPGQIAWRLSRDGETGDWNYGHSMSRETLAEGLDAETVYRIEIETTLLLDPSKAVDPAVADRLERFRDEVGAQGHFAEFSGFLLDEGSQTLPWPAPTLPYLDYLVYADSLSDGTVYEPNGGPEGEGLRERNNKGAAACWPRKAIRRACAIMKRKRTPRGVNQAFGGWWGCEIHFPPMASQTSKSCGAPAPGRRPLSSQC